MSKKRPTITDVAPKRRLSHLPDGRLRIAAATRLEIAAAVELEKLAHKNRRSISAEIAAAVDSHIRRAGKQ